MTCRFRDRGNELGFPGGPVRGIHVLEQGAPFRSSPPGNAEHAVRATFAEDVVEESLKLQGVGAAAGAPDLVRTAVPVDAFPDQRLAEAAARPFQGDLRDGALHERPPQGAVGNPALGEPVRSGAAQRRPLGIRRPYERIEWNPLGHPHGPQPEVLFLLVPHEVRVLLVHGDDVDRDSCRGVPSAWGGQPPDVVTGRPHGVQGGGGQVRDEALGERDLQRNGVIDAQGTLEEVQRVHSSMVPAAHQLRAQNVVIDRAVSKHAVSRVLQFDPASSETRKSSG